jgi:hypothetical protein
VKEEIGMSLSFDEIEPFLIYCPDSSKSQRHIAVCFLAELDDIEDLKPRIYEEELMRHREGSGTFFQDIDQLINESGKSFEPWSIEIAKNLFGKTFSEKITLTSEQISLFDIG